MRKGNESLFKKHPFLDHVYIWDKNRKYQSLIEIVREANQINYDLLINLQRFFTTGLFSLLIKSKTKVGFNKNPLSFIYDHSIQHKIGDNTHEIERNLKLLSFLNEDLSDCPVKLYPEDTSGIKESLIEEENYITISPASVWFTKQFPAEKWKDLINEFPEDIRIVLLGGPGDKDYCNEIERKSNHGLISNLCGKTSLLETAGIMSHSILNFVNDSAPMHLSSSQNAPTCAIFCSTIPEFGFGPLSDFRRVIQVKNLYCRPCGLHGKKKCPEDHFKCAYDIDIKKLLNAFNDALIYRKNLN